MKKYIDVILINIIALILGIGVYCLTKGKTEILGAMVATGISLSLGIRQYKTENDKIFKELFKEFNAKYDDKFNNRLEEIVKKSEADDGFCLSDDDRRLIIDYLNLCAEEYLWKIKGRIPDEVWKSWENGMIYYINKPIINEIVINERDQKDSYYGLFDKIQKRIDNWH